VAEPQAWPFLVVLMSDGSAASSKSAAPEARVRGLGWLVGDVVVTLAHVAERADTVVAVLDDLEIPVERIGSHERFAVLRVHGDSTAGRAASVSPFTAGAGCAVAIVSDDSPRVRLVRGQAQKLESDGRFTVALDQPLADYETASGSPVVTPDGTVFGIVGPTAMSGSVDAFGLDELQALIAQAPPATFELAGGISRDLVDPTEGIPLDRDDLGVHDYVNMFATVIADKHTPMPLSFGLFGEWGSGKSYFMGLLREQVTTLTGSGDERYCCDIVQIGFNAWHYSDSNLWASLGDEIFERLAGPGETDATRRRRLRKELGKKLQRRKELKEAAAAAKTEVTRLTLALDEASIERSASTREFVTAVLASPTFRSDLDEVWKRIGVKSTEEKVRLLTGELGETPADLATLNRALGGRRRWLVFAGIVVAVAVVVAGAVASRAWLAGGGAAVLAAVLAVADRTIMRVRSGARLLHEVAGNVRTQQAEGAEKARKQLRQAEANEQLVRVQLAEMTTQVADIGRELAELTPGQRLYNFIAERAASDTYRSQLGLISTIRKDFLELTRLMKAWQDGGGRKSPRPVDRIVLYIDDLDRCSPQQVVDVLQAVHLLLALELFVVVVGVDPRWLLRALRRQYRAMLTTGSRPAGPDPQWEVTTPQDYLEKIFNIPFSLPRMSPASFERLVRSVAVTEPSAGLEHEAALAQTTGNGGAAVASPTEVDTADIPVEAGSEVAALQSPEARPPDLRPVTEGELNMLAALAPLIETPRETKRLLNLYRMIRSTRNLSPASEFLGDDHTPGDHEAVVILLGLLSGHARLLEDVLAAPKSHGVKGGLRARSKNERWADFVADLQPRRPRSTWRNAVVGTIEEGDVADWKRLADGLAETSKLVTIPDLAPFQLWAPRIARFSFLLSPYAQEENAASTDAVTVQTG
jgi:KAP family P-loop domain